MKVFDQSTENLYNIFWKAKYSWIAKTEDVFEKNDLLFLNFKPNQ